MLRTYPALRAHRQQLATSGRVSGVPGDMTTAPFEPDPTDPNIVPSTQPTDPIDPVAPGEDPGGPVPDPQVDPAES